MKETDLTQNLPTDRIELAVRHTIGSIMSGRASVGQVVERLVKQGFQPAEIDAILKEASRRTMAVGEAANRNFYQTAINTGFVLLLIAMVSIVLVGYPQHGRGVGIFYTAIFFGLGALGYGAFGKLFRHH